MKSLSLIVVLALCACSIDVPVKGAEADQQAKLDQIADKCGVPRAFFNPKPDGILELHPAPDMKFEAVDCALKGVKRIGIPESKLTFLGNAKI